MQQSNQRKALAVKCFVIKKSYYNEFHGNFILKISMKFTLNFDLNVSFSKDQPIE